MHPMVLTIAGSDPSGGAGIQQDLRVFSQLGAHGMAAVAAITIQNTTGVKRFVSTDPGVLREQLEFLLQDVSPQAVKTGMLGSPENVRVVAKCLTDIDAPIIVDPVLAATGGDPLFNGDREALLEELFPLATVVTPNIHEASVLSNSEVKDLRSMREAAKNLKGYGPGWVIVKGGDMAGDKVVDLLYNGIEFHQFPHRRIRLSRETHGTGCAFASTLAVMLAQGLEVPTACKETISLMEMYLLGSYKVGHGAIPANPLVIGERERERCSVLERVGRAVEELEALSKGGILVPEVQINLCEAIPLARNHQDVAGVKGRIVRWGEGLRAAGCPSFGASHHVANIVLTAMKTDPSMRAAMNVRFEEGWIKLLKTSTFDVSSFSRGDEPPQIKAREGSTLEWGVAQVCTKLGRVPDIIYDRGDVGKEPMIRILGKNALDVVEKAKRILNMVL